jgi:hypothetical protein
VAVVVEVNLILVQQAVQVVAVLITPLRAAQEHLGKAMLVAQD